MNFWDILEIPQGSDTKTIKKAYSKLLKINNPEDNPEGYQRLREAYDAALKYAKKNAKNKENQEVINDNLDENATNEEGVSEDKEQEPENNINEDKQITFKPQIDINESLHKTVIEKYNLHIQINQLLNRLKDIYKDLSLRADPAVWEEFLNSAILWNVDAFPIIEEELFNFLSTHKHLPAEIWVKLNNNFNWSHSEIKLYKKYPDSMVDEFLKRLKDPSKLNYDYIKSINPEVADEYLYEREQAEKALKDKKYAKAYNHLKKANSLFEGDPELLSLKGDYEYELEHLKTALDYYKAALEINHKDLKSALHIGIILTSYKEFSEAVPYLKQYLAYKDDDKLALKHLAYCYYYSEDFMNAKDNFQKLLGLEENNKTIKKYLKNIEAKLLGKHVGMILFDRDDLASEEAVIDNTINELNIKDRILSNKLLILKYLIRIIILFAIFHGAIHSSVVKHPSDDYMYMPKNNMTYEDKNKEVLKNFERSILDPNNNNNIEMNLNNVKATSYYKISQPFENKSIFSETELEEKGLRDKVESQLYVGSTKVHVVIFADPKCSDKTIKDGGYMIHGAVVPMDEEIGNKIMQEHASEYQGLDWIYNGFIDAKAEKK